MTLPDTLRTWRGNAIPFDQQPIRDRLAALRGLLEHLEWVMAGPKTGSALEERRERDAAELRREIARLQDYRNKGFVFEPDF